MKTASAITNKSLNFNQVSPIELYGKVQKYIKDAINYTNVEDMMKVDSKGNVIYNKNSILNRMVEENITIKEILEGEFLKHRDSGTVRFLHAVMFETLNLKYPYKFKFPLLNKLLGNFTHRYHNEDLFKMPAIEKLVDNIVIQNLSVEDINQLEYTAKQFKKNSTRSC